MVVSVDEAEAQDNEILKNMEKLGIPPNFPLSLAHLSDETADLCQREELSSLEELADFAQKMAQQIVIGGDVYFLQTHAMVRSPIKRVNDLLSAGYGKRYEQRLDVFRGWTGIRL